ncbi:MAG: glycosyltransferase, partial [Planctomycetales bacterium]|nr:glycosyltransferase [Planctomycetales bacterium]
MHYVLSPFGSFGDVNPFLALGQELLRRGERVTMLANGYFSAAVQRAGLGYIELGTKDEYLDAAANPLLWSPLRALRLILSEGVTAVMRQHYQHLEALQQQEPIVAVSNLFGAGAMVAREKLGIPLAVIHLQPSVFWSDLRPPRLPGLFGPLWLQRWMYHVGERYWIDPAFCPALNKWRAELGLSPVQGVTHWWHQAELVGALFPDWFGPPQPDWPQPFVQTSFPLWDEQHDEPLAPEIESFLSEGEPPIVFTPGSANQFGNEYFTAAVGACERLQRRGLLLTRFPEQIPENLPNDVRYFSYAPFQLLLPRSAALVHHGGIGSTAQAMAAGIPQLIAAMAHDQFDNAQRIHQLQVGDSTKFVGLNARRLARKLQPLLESAAVGEACRRAANKLAARDGIAQMAAHLQARFNSKPADAVSGQTS